jgi:hypothetical protein
MIDEDNLKLALYVDWIGQTYNSRELWVWSAKLKYQGEFFWWV